MEMIHDEVPGITSLDSEDVTLMKKDSSFKSSKETFLRLKR